MFFKQPYRYASVDLELCFYNHFLRENRIEIFPLYIHILINIYSHANESMVSISLIKLVGGSWCMKKKCFHEKYFNYK